MHEEETSTSSNNGPIWKHIWSVKVVPKCRILVWRACKNIIPVRMNLKKWMVDVDSIRPYSGDPSGSDFGQCFGFYVTKRS